MRPAMCLSKGFEDADLDGEDLAPMLRSLRFFRASYNHQKNPEGFFYESLRV